VGAVILPFSCSWSRGNFRVTTTFNFASCVVRRRFPVNKVYVMCGWLLFAAFFCEPFCHVNYI